jgi:hypothetical protein
VLYLNDLPNKPPQTTSNDSANAPTPERPGTRAAGTAGGPTVGRPGERKTVVRTVSWSPRPANTFWKDCESPSNWGAYWHAAARDIRHDTRASAR